MLRSLPSMSVADSTRAGSVAFGAPAKHMGMCSASIVRCNVPLLIASALLVHKVKQTSAFTRVIDALLRNNALASTFNQCYV